MFPGSLSSASLSPVRCFLLFVNNRSWWVPHVRISVVILLLLGGTSDENLSANIRIRVVERSKWFEFILLLLKPLLMVLEGKHFEMVDHSIKVVFLALLNRLLRFVYHIIFFRWRALRFLELRLFGFTNYYIIIFLGI